MKIILHWLLLVLTTLSMQVYAQGSDPAALNKVISSVQVSSPLHDSDIKVRVRDGVELSVEIYRPLTPGPHPTLLAAGPYPVSSANEAPDSELTGPIAWLVSQGYNYVLANVRGTGASTGQFELMSRDEQQDLYELVEWIANQSWSDGQIAGIGAGYYGSSQWFMAIQNPPHLACIAPVEAIIDPYRDWAWHGGIANNEFLRWYEQDIREAHAYPPKGPARYLDFDLHLQQLQHKLPDSWWSLRSVVTNLDQVKVPVFQLGSFNDSFSPWLGALKQLQNMPGDTHTYISASADLLQDPVFLAQELLPFYQWCFNGKPVSGPALQPKLRYQVQNSEPARSSTGWPPANINYTPLFLLASTTTQLNDGSLALNQDQPSRNLSQLGGNNPASSLVFRSPPVSQDVVIAGPVLLELHASSSATDTAFAVELYEESSQVQFPETPPLIPDFLKPQGTSQNLFTARKALLISSGVLKASNRALTTSAQSNMQVEYTYGEPQALYPGRIYRLDLALDPVARRIRAGSALILKISQISDAELRGMVRTDTLYHTLQYPSRLWLPLAADANLAFSAQAPISSIPQTAGGNKDNFFILDSLIPTSREADKEPMTAAEKLADDLFNSNSPVILLPR